MSNRIGPVEVDELGGVVTLHAAVYRLTKPVVFGLIDQTVIEDAVIGWGAYGKRRDGTIGPEEPGNPVLYGVNLGDPRHPIFEWSDGSKTLENL